MRSYNPVPGFAVDFTRDTDYYNPSSGLPPPNPGVINPAWGRPTCKEWWEDSRRAREQMISHSSTWQQLLTVGASAMTWGSNDQRKDSTGWRRPWPIPALSIRDRISGRTMTWRPALGASGAP